MQIAQVDLGVWPRQRSPRFPAAATRP